MGGGWKTVVTLFRVYLEVMRRVRASTSLRKSILEFSK